MCVIIEVVVDVEFYSVNIQKVRYLNIDYNMSQLIGFIILCWNIPAIFIYV